MPTNIFAADADQPMPTNILSRKRLLDTREASESFETDSKNKADKIQKTHKQEYEGLVDRLKRIMIKADELVIEEQIDVIRGCPSDGGM